MTHRTTVGAAYRAGTARLDAAGVPDAANDAAWLLLHVLGETSRSALFVRAGEPLGDETAARCDALLARRARREPLQYILGSELFYGRGFCVTPDVLIPRADTELLCVRALEALGMARARVLDIGTGSGALAITLALERPMADVTAVDISEAALAVARDNARRLGAQVRFVRSDLFAGLSPAQGAYDVIVSNPPYIVRAQVDALQPEVRCEPRLALDGGDDGLFFYRALAAQAAAYLAPGGTLLLEVGAGQAQAVCALLAGIGPTASCADSQGIARVVWATRQDKPAQESAGTREAAK